jgi:hypothetical protein
MQQLDIIPVKLKEGESVFDEYLSEANFAFLAGCAVHYAGLLGKSIDMPAGSLRERICMLHHRFAALLPDGQFLNFETCDSRLMWVVYCFHGWDDRTFYWMPVKFITLLTGKIREAAMSFTHLFIRKNGLCSFANSYESDFFFEWMLESVTADNLRDVERQQLLDLIESYMTGEISVFLNGLYHHKPVADMAALLEECRPANPQEEKLLEMFRRGLPLISGTDSIMNYDYDPYGECTHEEYDDCQPVTLDRIVRYVWETDDFVASDLEAMNNQCLQETYAQEPVSYLLLNTDSKLLALGDYPERFSQWFLEMTAAIKEFTLAFYTPFRYSPLQHPQQTITFAPSIHYK